MSVWPIKKTIFLCQSQKISILAERCEVSRLYYPFSRHSNGREVKKNYT